MGGTHSMIQHRTAVLMCWPSYQKPTRSTQQINITHRQTTHTISWSAKNHVRRQNGRHNQEKIAHGHILYATIVSQPLYRWTCISRHLQLRNGGLCWCNVLLMATSTFGLRRRCWSSPQQCYLHCLHILS